MTSLICSRVARPTGRRALGLVVVLLVMSLLVWAGPLEQKGWAATSLRVSHDTSRGRIAVENDVLKLEFGYKTEPATHDNQAGGNLYYYYDKRFSPSRNIISVWEDGSSDTKAYASGAGGIGSTQIYASTLR